MFTQLLMSWWQLAMQMGGGGLGAEGEPGAIVLSTVVHLKPLGDLSLKRTPDQVEVKFDKNS